MVRADVPDAGDPRTRQARLALLALAALLFVVVRLPFLSVPLERDEGEYAYIADRALHGELPYRDAFDQKPPGIFALYLLAFALFGRSTEGIHGFMYLWSAATCLALHGLVRRAAGGLAAAFAVLIFAVISIEPRLAATAANTEVFMLLPLVASAALLLRALEGDAGPAWFGCAALAAAACWIKPVALSHGVLAVVAAAALARGEPRAHRLRRLFRRLGWLCLGCVAASLPPLLLLAALGALGAFADAVVLHNLRYVARLPLSEGLGNAGAMLARQAPSLGPYWLLCLAGLVRPGALPRRGRLLLAGFTAASAAGAVSGLYFRPHYFVQLLPALAATSGVAAAALLRSLRGRWPAVAGLGAALLAGLLPAPPLIANHTLLRGSPEQISRWIYGVNPFVESPRIADYIRRTSSPTDRVYVVGSEPQILFHARRRSATRYIFFYPLTGPFPDALERQRELMAEVEAARPLYVVWVDLPTSLGIDEHSERWVLEATRALLERDYRLEFVALPPETAHGSFDFVYGGRARELLRRSRAGREAVPWIAVFRRAPRG